MNPWEKEWLSPFEALQAIVAERSGPERADALSNYSLKARFTLLHSADGDAIRAAFTAADNDLRDWCSRGLVRGRGFRVFTPYSAIGSRREDLAKWWDNARELDFVEGGYEGEPSFAAVELGREDIARLARQSMATNDVRQKVPMPPARELATVSAGASSDNQCEASSVVRRERSTPQHRRLEAACRDSFPNGISQCWSGKQVYGRFKDALGASCPSQRTVERFVKSLRLPRQ